MSLAMSQASAPAGQVTQQFGTLITGAFGVVAALAWSDAINSYFRKIKFFAGMPLLGPFLFAAFITLVAYAVGAALSGYAKTPCTQLCAPPATPPPSTRSPLPAPGTTAAATR